MKKGEAAFWVQVSADKNGEVQFRFVPVTIESYGKQQATAKLLENGKMTKRRFYAWEMAGIVDGHPLNRFPRLIPADQDLANKLAAENFERIGRNHLDGLIACDESWMKHTAAGSIAKYGRTYADQVTARLATLKSTVPTLKVIFGIWTPEEAKS